MLPSTPPTWSLAPLSVPWAGRSLAPLSLPWAGRRAPSISWSLASCETLGLEKATSFPVKVPTRFSPNLRRARI